MTDLDIARVLNDHAKLTIPKLQAHGEDLTALWSTVESLRQLLLTLLAANQDAEAKKEQWISTIDLSMGNHLPMSASNFEAFCRGERQSTSLERLLFQFRVTMIAKLEELLQPTAGESS